MALLRMNYTLAFPRKYSNRKVSDFTFLICETTHKKSSEVCYTVYATLISYEVYEYLSSENEKINPTIPTTVGFSVKYKPSISTVRFKGAMLESSNDIFIPYDLRSIGLGGFLFNKLGVFAKNNFPETSLVSPLFLSSRDAENDLDKNRRNNFYKSFGFHLNFKDDKEKMGSAQMKELRDFIEKPVTEARQAVPLSDLINDKNKRLKQLRLEIGRMEKIIDRYETKEKESLKKLNFHYKATLYMGVALVLAVVCVIYRL